MVEINERVALQWSATNKDVREVVVLEIGNRVCVLRRPAPNAVRAALTKVCKEAGI